MYHCSNNTNLYVHLNRTNQLNIPTMKKITFLVSFLTVAMNVSALWSTQNSGVFDDLIGCHFVNNTTGWAVGQSGTIISTTNAGTSWSSQTSGTTSTLRSVFFIDASSGWAVGNGGTIVYTANGGVSWSSQNSGTTQNLNDVFFVDANKGWAVGNHSTILATTDAGTTWSTQTLPYFGIYYDLQSVYFNSATGGYAVGESGEVASTTSSGNSWNDSNIGTATFFGSFISTSTQACLVGAVGTVYYKSASSIWKTGTTNTTEALNAVSFIDEQNGWASGDNGTIINTSDDGKNWATQSSGVTNHLYDIAFTDASTGWAVGAGGTIVHTSDGGVIPSVKSYTSSTRLQAFPNPFTVSTVLEFENTDSEDLQLVIFDISGRTVQEHENITGNKVVIQRENLSSGTYYVHLIGESIRINTRLIVE